jgi:hypothetical protein
MNEATSVGEAAVVAELRRGLEVAADAFAICQLAFSAAFKRWQEKSPEEDRAWKGENGPRVTELPGWQAEVAAANTTIMQAEATLKAACLALYVARQP